MRKSIQITIALVLGWNGGIRAAAQAVEPAKHGVAAVWDDADFTPGFSFNQTLDFGKAKVTGTDGKTHEVYIPVSTLGFAGLLPFFYQQTDIGRFGSVPLNISVDKVQAIQAGELYFEHLAIKGKRLHILGARVANGPIELFNYTQTKQISNAGVNGSYGSYIVYPKRHWYLRRQGELVEVSRHNFVPQLTQFFQDDPEIVAALTNQQLRYRDMVAVVEAYNQHRGIIPNQAATN